MSMQAEGRAARRRGRTLILAIPILAVAMALAACAVPQNALPQADLEATVEAMVDARLTEVAADATSGDTAGAGAAGAAETGSEIASGGQPVLMTPTPDQSGAINDYLVANTRHFKGAPDAPVIIIEFSDFQ